MKRAIITAIFLFSGALNAAATPEDTYYDLIRPNGHPRSDAVFQADLEACYNQTGADRTRRDTPAFKKCMLGRGNRWMSTRNVPTPPAPAAVGPLACSARVLKIEDTGWALNHHNFARMTLSVTPPRGRAFVTTIAKEVSNHNPPRAGGTMRVTCDPANPSEIHPLP